jgi:opine dehydrogenase
LGPEQILVVFTAAFGGLEWAAAARRQGLTWRTPIVEAENLPYGARTIGPGEVRILVDVPEVLAGVFPARETGAVSERALELFPMLRFKKDLLEPLLSNVNGVVHPPVTLLNVTEVDRARGEPWWVWERGVTESVARVIERLDRERIALGRHYGLKLAPAAEVLWRTGYGPKGTIYETLNGCAALRKIKGPDTLEHRWFTEDIPCVLRLWADLARVAGVAAPTMSALIELAVAITGKDSWRNGRTLASLGLGEREAARLPEFLESGHVGL